MRIEWLPEAERNLTAQLEWVAEHNPWASIDMGDAIFSAIDRLANHPAMARPGRVAGTRELVVLGTPYVVVYRIEANAVVIMRILHGVVPSTGRVASCRLSLRSASSLLARVSKGSSSGPTARSPSRAIIAGGMQSLLLAILLPDQGLHASARQAAARAGRRTSSDPRRPSTRSPARGSVRPVEARERVARPGTYR
ncbi:MAG: type II toxin-antitoxin system RelE/ParE family toxin [Euzebya sp.]